MHKKNGNDRSEAGEREGRGGEGREAKGRVEER